MQMPNLPPVFLQQGASFVTLNLNGNLRGCIGSIVAQRSYIEDITANAQNAAFKDPRFSPLTIDEFPNLEIDVSLLSQPVKIEFEDEEDLLAKIVPFKDGIIIKDGFYQAVYLPSVWEQLPEKRLFLDSLKIKAGMTPEHFSKTFEAYRFYTEMVK
jgi:AmmeMemoRadiSam system protein A